ncbi:phage tail protein [Oceanisphaera psychrotolerans]|uniref:phage tail protein n=1 Tax=Oceanisphaera psychrotolerans TaxID=1414654 RepID=UPI0009F2264A|nr:phage tail protein [Oceanisphaera psychrotolerans]
MDEAGYPHYVTPLATLAANGAVTDLRGRGGLWWHEQRPQAHTKEQVGLDKLENWGWSHSYTDTTGGATKYASGKAVADAYNALNSSKLDKTGKAADSAKFNGQLPSFYLDWGNFTGVPVTATRWPSFAEVTGKPATYPPDSHAHSWSSITGKPSTFTPSNHSHPWSEVTDKPAQATRWPNWNEVTGKPAGIDEPGLVAAFAMATPPDGWLKANGAAISRTTYSALFAAIGTTFGAGNGSTTFNIPDLRGEFVRGWDDSRGVDAGRALGSWQEDEFKEHGTHGTNSTKKQASDNNTQAYVRSDGDMAGLRGGDETRPRNVAFLYCIKY